MTSLAELRKKLKEKKNAEKEMGVDEKPEATEGGKESRPTAEETTEIVQTHALEGKKQTKGKIFIKREFKSQGESIADDDEGDTLEVRTYPSEVPLGKVSVSGGVTISLGNFEFSRIDVTIEVPCAVEEIDDAYDFVKATVEKKLTEEVIEIKQHVERKDK